MDQAYSPRQTVDTPWRTAAIVAAAVAAVELFILVLVGIVFGAKLLTGHAEKAIITATGENTSATTPPATSTPAQKTRTAKSTPVAELARKRTSVVVLNGNGTAGAAAVTADRLRHFHYIVAATGNAPRSNFTRSIVMYRTGYEGEAIRLAHDLHLRRAAPLDGLKLRDLQGAHLALIIGG